VLAPPGQRLVVAHGLMDRWTSPRGSLRWAERARTAGVRIARFELPMVGHFMLGSGREWNALVRRASLGLLGLEPLPAPVERAYTATGARAPDGLSLPISSLVDP
ncbi:MAG: alpha/beta hydrolase, partial [Actinomycetota bacterium]|nr:alpha/beta hydrolase [Actinomycetota bacterium]